MGLLFLFKPIVLGSVYVFLIFLAYPIWITKRIRHEERFFAEQAIGCGFLLMVNEMGVLQFLQHPQKTIHLATVCVSLKRHKSISFVL